ncbi:MAG: RecQ family ATP-dependent DNA helicase, partial [Marinilabiliales bacterium]
HKKDTLVLLPTGGGKSIIFQVPALAMEGICLVVTPLIALMKDQVENLKKRGIKATAIYTGLTRHEIDIILNNCIYGDFKFLYISPERLGTEIFRERIKDMNVCLLAIDEAHCISQWGYDFRPSYLKITEIRQFIPDTPILALTATATSDVVDDIQEKLGFTEKNVFRKSFERKNLIYIVRDVEDKNKKLLQALSKEKGSAVVYVRSRKRTKEYSDLLQKYGIRADYYHAGLSNELRDLKQANWKKGKTRVIVATNAFGMGIDKPDVRIVVHMDLPNSLEAYFQEAGRAGRDEKKAYALLLYNKADKTNLEKQILKSFPGKEVIKKVYNSLGNYFQLPVGAGKAMSYDFNIFEFAKKTQLDTITIFHCLKILQQEGYIEYTDDINHPSRIIFNVKRDDLYKFQVANATFDGFIKLVLRSYTGLFTDYVSIDENYLSKKANVSRDVIYNFLVKLSTAGIINFIPQKKNPLVTYTEERLDEKSLFLSQKEYNERKKRQINKIEKAIQYAESTAKCRSQILLEYFGEKNPYRCGQCDICQKRNELNLSKYEFDLILDELKELIRNESLTLHELVDKVEYAEENTTKVLQWLLDNNKIQLSNNQKFEWNN